MIDVALSPEAARFREQLRNGGMLPASAPVETEQPRSNTDKPRVRKPDTVGRFKTMNEFVDFSARLVDTTAQAVWMVLFREVKPSGVASVSFGQIAERTGVCRRTVIRAIKKLEEAKLVTVMKRGRLNEGPSKYQVHGTPNRSSTGDTHVTSTGDTNVT